MHYVCISKPSETFSGPRMVNFQIYDLIFIRVIFGIINIPDFFLDPILSILDVEWVFNNTLHPGFV